MFKHLYIPSNIRTSDFFFSFHKKFNVDIAPLAEGIAALGIRIDELLALEVGIKEAAKYYNLPYVSAAMRYSMLNLCAQMFNFTTLVLELCSISTLGRQH